MRLINLWQLLEAYRLIEDGLDMHWTRLLQVKFIWLKTGKHNTHISLITPNDLLIKIHLGKEKRQ